MFAMEPSWRRQQTPILVEMGYGAHSGEPPPGCASPAGTVEDSDLLSAQAYAECKDDVDYTPHANNPDS